MKWKLGMARPTVEGKNRERTSKTQGKVLTARGGREAGFKAGRMEDTTLG